MPALSALHGAREWPRHARGIGRTGPRPRATQPGSCSLMTTQPFSCVCTMPRSSRSFITRLTISRDAPTTLAMSWRETLLRMILTRRSIFDHVEQRAGDPAVDVEQGERLDLPVGAAQALHQAAHDRVRQARVLGQAARELGAAEDQHVGLDLGADRRRVRLVVDQAHLADVVARLQDREDDLAAARIGGQYPGATGQQDEERVRLLAMLDHDLAAPEAPLDDAVGDALRLLVGQQREQRHAPDEIEVREHRHLRTLSCWIVRAVPIQTGFTPRV